MGRSVLLSGTGARTITSEDLENALEEDGGLPTSRQISTLDLLLKNFQLILGSQTLERTTLAKRLITTLSLVY